MIHFSTDVRGASDLCVPSSDGVWEMLTTSGTSLSQRRSHGIEPTINVDDFSGDGPGVVGEKKADRLRHWRCVRCRPGQWSRGGVGIG